MIRCKNACPLDIFDGCCYSCTQKTCDKECILDPDSCEEAIFEDAEIEAFQDKSAIIIKKIGEILKQKAEIEAAEKTIRDQLQQAMEKYGIKKWDNELIKITYIEPTTRESIDSAKLKAQMPDIAAKFTKKSDVKAHVKIELRSGDKVEKN